LRHLQAAEKSKRDDQDKAKAIGNNSAIQKVFNAVMVIKENFAMRS